MAPTTPTGPPTQVVAGDSWRWKVSDLVDYPQSEGWSLKYELVGRSDTVTITPTWQTSGDDIYTWLATVATTTTDALSPGLYTLILRAIGSGDYDGREETISTAPWYVTVLADPRTAAAGDFRPFAEEMLEVIEAAIAGRLTKDMESYSIAGRSITKIPIGELMTLRAKFSNELQSSRSGQLGRDVAVVFGHV